MSRSSLLRAFFLGVVIAATWVLFVAFHLFARQGILLKINSKEKSKTASVCPRQITVKVKCSDSQDSMIKSPCHRQTSYVKYPAYARLTPLPLPRPCGLTLIGALIKASRYNSYHTNLKLFIVFFIKLCQGTKRVLPPHFFSDADHKPKRLLLLTFYLVTFISLQFHAPIQARAIASSQPPHPVSTCPHTPLKVLPQLCFTALCVPDSVCGPKHATGPKLLLRFL